MFNQNFIIECKVKLDFEAINMSIVAITYDFLQLFLIKPMVYTSGTRIPYYIQVSSPIEDDETHAISQAVDLLQLPSSVTISLHRNARLTGQLSQRFTDPVVAGTTWVRRGALEGRILQGEIDVPRGTPTDFSFPALEISVSPLCVAQPCRYAKWPIVHGF
ncbi:hypothetical protein DL93DRAFT_687377 [Clavulina sp. PMI_390]|nr:hypothetical protein DL93DRAFT_687377 [Clavulina sp. PMI_390]